MNTTQGLVQKNNRAQLALDVFMEIKNKYFSLKNFAHTPVIVHTEPPEKFFARIYSKVRNTHIHANKKREVDILKITLSGENLFDFKIFFSQQVSRTVSDEIRRKFSENGFVENSETDK